MFWIVNFLSIHLFVTYGIGVFTTSHSTIVPEENTWKTFAMSPILVPILLWIELMFILMMPKYEPPLTTQEKRYVTNRLAALSDRMNSV